MLTSQATSLILLLLAGSSHAVQICCSSFAGNTCTKDQYERHRQNIILNQMINYRGETVSERAPDLVLGPIRKIGRSTTNVRCGTDSNTKSRLGTALYSILQPMALTTSPVSRRKTLFSVETSSINLCLETLTHLLV
ncbi:hypothetical protein CTRI78_v008126 [Colletotrichum trifolii]|uniref:Uncharacterized protein n=1 Tax=Colletotrichum trifolii TaxID=5466 RepID=A0A4R8R0F6_COLTR|nr:hypothetical protein CTRI78_v008126 [Colletotrichum trifolii]